MEKMRISDIPPPSELTESKKICLVLDKRIVADALKKLEELGWVWPGFPKKPTEFNPWHNEDIKIWLYDYVMAYSQADYICIAEIWNDFEIVSDLDQIPLSAFSAAELKKLNTLPGLTNCASCGGKLKDPGMGPTYKHCPKCEP